MGQRNMLYGGPMLDIEPLQGHHHPYNHQTMLQTPGNRTAFGPRYLHENLGQRPYVNARHNCEHCYTLVIPAPNDGVFSVPVNHDHFPFSNSHQIFERNRRLFMDEYNGVFKRSGSSVMVPTTSERNRANGAMGFDFDLGAVHNSSHLVHGGQLVQAVSAGAFSWNRAHGVRPYLQDMGLHAYQVASMSRNSLAFMPPPVRPHQGSHNVYHPPLPPPPMLPVQAPNMDIHLHLPSTSHRHSTRTSSTADPGPVFLGPAPLNDIMLYEARRQQLMINSIARHHGFPHLRVVPVEEFQIGNPDSGLSDNFISDHLKTRTFVSFRHHSEDLMPADEEPNFCVICQMEFEDQDKIGMLDCCHEYHVECIKKWLVVKNNCPICKSTALH